MVNFVLRRSFKYTLIRIILNQWILPIFNEYEIELLVGVYYQSLWISTQIEQNLFRALLKVKFDVYEKIVSALEKKFSYIYGGKVHSSLDRAISVLPGELSLVVYFIGG